MKRAGVVAALALGAVIVAGCDKRAPRQRPSAGEAKRRYRVDFAGPTGGDNLFSAREPDAGETFFQDKKPHRLTLEHLVDAPLTLDTNDTFIDYIDGKLVWMTVYLAPDTVTFREAVRITEAELRRAGLGARFDAREYDRHLGPVSDHEIWAPELTLPHARVTPKLNCNWEWHQPASAQVDHVACRPHLSIKVPGGADAQGR